MRDVHRSSGMVKRNKEKPFKNVCRNVNSYARVGKILEVVLYEKGVNYVQHIVWLRGANYLQSHPWNG